MTHLLVDHWQLRLHLTTTYILINCSYLFVVVVCVFNPACELAHREINLQIISAKSIITKDIFALGAFVSGNFSFGSSGSDAHLLSIFCDFLDKEITFHFPSFPPFKGKIQMGQVNPGRHEFFEDTSFPSQTTLKVKAGCLTD